MEGRERGAGVGRFKINGTTEERSRRKRKEETLRGEEGHMEVKQRRMVEVKDGGQKVSRGAVCFVLC